MDRVSTQRRRPGRNVGFAPVAQTESDLEASDDVSQYWELPVNEPLDRDLHSRVRNIFRNAVPPGQFDEDEWLQHVAANTAETVYAPVDNLVALDGLEEATIAELAGPGTIEYYAPYARGHDRAPSSLSNESDARTEKTYVEKEQWDSKDKFLRFEPMVTTIEVDDEVPSHPPKKLPNYKPAALRRMFLVILFSAAVALLAVMVTALLVLPKSSNSVASDIISRNTSEIKLRSSGITQRSLQHAYGLVGPRGHGDSGSSSAEESASEDEQTSKATSSTTLKDVDDATTVLKTTTTTSKVSDGTTSVPESDPSETKSELGQTPDTSTTSSTLHTSSSSSTTRNQDDTTTKTTTAAEAASTPTDTQPTKPSKGGDDASPTTMRATTVATSIATTAVTTSSEKTDPTQNESTMTTTKNDPEPSDGGHGSEGDKTRPNSGHEQSTGSETSQTSTTSTSSKNTDSSNSHPETTSSTKFGDDGPKPTKETDHTSQAETATTTSTSISQSPPGHESETLPTSSSTTSNGDFSSPYLTTNSVRATCTVEVVQTHTSWVVLPVSTVDLGLVKKFALPPVTRMDRRQADSCDTTVTNTRDTTIWITTAHQTVTIGVPPDPTTSAIENTGGSISTTSTTSAVLTDPQTNTLPIDPGTTATGSAPDVTSPSTTTNAAGSPTDLPGDGSTPTTTLPSSQPSQQPGDATTSENAGVTTSATTPNGPDPTDIHITVPEDTNTAPNPGTTASSAPPVFESSSVATTPGSTTTTISVDVPPPPSSIVITEIYTTTNADSSVTTSTSLSTILINPGTTVNNGGQPPPETLPNQVSTTVQHTVTVPTVNTQNTGPGHAEPTTNAQGGNNDNGPPPETSKTTPVTTFVRVVQSTTVVLSIETTITPTSTVTDDSGLVAVGAFITTVPFTTALAFTQVKAITKDDGDTASGATQKIVTNTYMDKDGNPTATMLETLYAHAFTSIEKDSDGWPTKTVIQEIQETPLTTTMTDRYGKIKIKTYFEDTSTKAMTDSHGKTTGFQIFYITDLPTVVTTTDAAGHTLTITQMMPAGTSTSFSTVLVDPTSTPIANGSATNPTIAALPVSSGYYFLGILLPTLLAIGISIPIRVLDSTVKLHQPFSAMTLSYGARPADSLGLKTTGLWGLTSGFVSPRMGNWLLAVTGLLVVANSILIALSTEALDLEVQDVNCTMSSDGLFKTCPTSVVISMAPAKSTTGLICLMAILIAVAAKALWRRRSGVINDIPWSIFEMRRLAQHESTLTSLNKLDWKFGNVTRDEVIRAFGKRRFKLDYWKNGNAGWEYVVQVANDDGDYAKDKRSGIHRMCSMPFFTLTLLGRVLFFLFLLALALMVLLYHNTHGAFQDFMDSENFGGRFILTGAGVIISMIWWTFFTCVAFLSPYRLIVRKKSVQDALYLSPPSNPFSGFWRVISRQHPDKFLGVVAFTAILSEFLPLFLANVPARLEEPDSMSAACVWLSISVICIMAVVLISSFLITWPPEMPMDPSTVAGAMFYALESMASMKRKSSSTLGGVSMNTV
ncbi:hypothetical protein PFICI_09056 [Pestalotiopsis fici W106-1]|uniref:Uncharacterized protein n=1 Tax=Pestalotiopsis fici (strain W106-1 / CGMCC3.15140) TaxID=1229662 RepID=W3WZB3_PESFW|nr:uncharacterized protein PFICI_09056 [Pestalotiopsis fici W106-1]ETS79203.1 hypothetical protein PFICI_09056 [Pestalotiopsis fici W106-1]